jgi:putative PIN family toxin of toxin-antitoxin system
LLRGKYRFISAAISPNGRAAKAYFKATEPPYECILCDYCVDEFKRIVRKKLPKYVPFVDTFLSTALNTVKVIIAPPESERVAAEANIRDVKDQPIIRAAVKAKVDIILTGDKDFLASGIVCPKILSPSEFIVWDF